MGEIPSPYLIEPTKAGTYILKRGTWRGDTIRWTKVGVYASLIQCVEATKTGDNR